MSGFVTLENVVKRYRMGDVVVNAADGVTFCVEKGEFAVVVGPSGAGKTTVLNMLGGMDVCDSGRIVVGGEEISAYRGKRLTAYRRYEIGFVFQFYNLVGTLTALENVELASQICRVSRRDTCAPLDPAEVLRGVGLGDRMDNFPSQLSGGEQQRVSIARAIAKNPKLLLCDEPTGALDYQTGKKILSLLHEMCRGRQMTVIVITHNQAITPMADRVIRLKNGRVSEITANDSPVDVERIEW